MRILNIIFLTFLLSGSLLAKNLYFQEGLVFYENKDFEKAKFKFEQDIVFNPKSENSYLYLSKIFNLQEKKELEEKNLNTVILINPKNEEATFNLADLKLGESDFSGSKILVDELLLFCKNYCQKAKTLKIEIEKSLKK
jgi:tetratricopeptide (TPR) repeat protein